MCGITAGRNGQGPQKRVLRENTADFLCIGCDEARPTRGFGDGVKTGPTESAAPYIGKGRVLRRAIEADRIPSMILWGPPGCGKTTLAYIIATSTGAFFAPVSAVSATVADLRRIIQQAPERRKVHLQKTILFIDEIHRFNKTQQDAVLPFVEDGTVILIGATTENPSFEVTSPLLSRTRVVPLKPLTEERSRC